MKKPTMPIKILGTIAIVSSQFKSTNCPIHPQFNTITAISRTTQQGSSASNKKTRQRIHLLLPLLLFEPALLFFLLHPRLLLQSAAQHIQHNELGHNNDDKKRIQFENAKSQIGNRKRLLLARCIGGARGGGVHFEGGEGFRRLRRLRRHGRRRSSPSLL